MAMMLPMAILGTFVFIFVSTSALWCLLGAAQVRSFPGRSTQVAARQLRSASRCWDSVSSLFAKTNIVEGWFYRWMSTAKMASVESRCRDDPGLTVRRVALREGQSQPLRVILDPNLRIPPKSALLSDGHRTLVVCSGTLSFGCLPVFSFV